MEIDLSQFEMKKAVLTLIVLLAGWFSAQAQVWIGGSLGARLGKDTQSFTIAPDVGYSFSNVPFSVGCSLEYGGTVKKEEAYSHELTVSPYFRYDICDIGERFTLFMDLYTDFEVLEFNSFDVGLDSGISFDVTEHWSTEFCIGLLEYKRERVPDEKPRQTFELSFKAVAPSFKLYYNF